jgi:hypothetical protein
MSPDGATLAGDLGVVRPIRAAARGGLKASSHRNDGDDDFATTCSHGLLAIRIGRGTMGPKGLGCGSLTHPTDHECRGVRVACDHSV